MKYLAVLLLALASLSASAQAASVINVAWVNPTTGVDNTTPLTGVNALTGIEVYVSTSPIADNSTMVPTLTADVAAATAKYALQVSPGQTVYVRLKAVTLLGRSAFSNQQSKVVPMLPNAPTSVTITITVS